MQGHDIIVIGTSAGGVEALTTIAKKLPDNLDAAVFIVLHIPAQAPSVLPTILTRVGRLPASHPEDYQKIERGNIYIAPPDHHLLVEEGFMRVVRGPRENRHRPAVDPLFRSAARAYGQRVVGVVLTGALDDGTAGLWAIKMRGGTAIVQEPDDAFHPGMPLNALENVEVDYVLPLEQIPDMLVNLVNAPVIDEDQGPVPEKIDLETRIAQMEDAVSDIEDVAKLGNVSVYTCPECHGMLWELHDGNLLRFRCHVGHSYTIENMVSAQSESVERALWAALRALEERATLLRRLADRSSELAHSKTAGAFHERAATAEENAKTIRQILTQDGDALAEEAS